MSRTPTDRRPTRAEVEGFREGVAHSLGVRRRHGDPDLPGEADLREADRELALGGLDAAESLLTRAHERLAAAEPEREVAERPRGLVSFVAPGPPDAPTPKEEDRLRNRLLLVTRLAQVRDPTGHEVAEALGLLRRAEAALDAGDRTGAKALVDAATGLLDRSMDPRRTRPEGPGTPGDR
ncbi:MAG TPA: hypothetical protein VGS23_03450 [Thermoplasmata archaeon]|nr:hypothetical protein [Thermoplasmata archaeon]